MLKCSECVYYERDEETGFGTCLFFEADKFAPCEEEDYEGEPYEDVVDDYDGWDEEEEYE